MIKRPVAIEGPWPDARSTFSGPMLSTLLVIGALVGGESFVPGSHRSCAPANPLASNPSVPSVEQIADMLAVVIWADLLMADELEDIASSR